MRRLPLYSPDYKLPIQEMKAEPLDRECEKCPETLRAGLRAVCMAPEGEGGGLLFLGDWPTTEDDKSKTPLTGQVRRELESIMDRAQYDGPVAFDVALRCNPPKEWESKEFKKWLENCKPYLATSFRDLAPQRVICMGPYAAAALLGRTVDTYSSRRGVAWVGDVPVFWLPTYERSVMNRFFMERFRADAEWAITTPADKLPRPPKDGFCNIVEGYDDALAAEAELRAAGGFAFDVETAGMMYGDGFRVLCTAMAPFRRDMAWVWPETVLENPMVYEIFARLLTDETLPKAGQNGKFDIKAVRARYKLVVKGYKHDTHIIARARYSDAKATLDTIAELVGMGGHKKELRTVLLQQRERINKTREKVRKGKLGVETIEDPQLRRAVEMDELKADAFAYGLTAKVAPELLWRYNALDAVSTSRGVFRLLPEVMGAVYPGYKGKDLGEHYERLITKLPPALVQIEDWGMPVSLERMRAADELVAGKLALVADKIQALKPGLNPRSNDQLRDYIYKELKLPEQKSFKKRKKEGPAVDAHALKGLKDKHPFIPLLMEFKKLDKLRGTYTLGLQQFVTPDGRIHPWFNPGGTKTGRLSSQEPNLQNVGGGKEEADKAMGKMLKDMFVASPGYVLLQLDYSQLELRVAALLCEDPAMRDIFVRGLDYHMAAAKLVAPSAWGIKPEDVTKAHRSMVKTVVFGLLYGMTDHGLSTRLGIKVEEAARLRQAIFGGFPFLARWYQRMHRYAMDYGRCLTYWKGQPARVRPLLDIADTTGEKPRWNGEEVMTPGKRKARNAAINTPVQGSASDFMLMSLVEIVDDILEGDLPARVIGSVHDSAIIEVREDYAETMALYAQETMEAQGWGDVPIAVDIERGPSWGSLKPWDPRKSRDLTHKAQAALASGELVEAKKLLVEAIKLSEWNAEAANMMQEMESAHAA